jgi:predicted GNAT family N-acyltransferase
MNIIYNFSDNHIQQLHQLYKEVWWGKDRTIEETRNGVNGSQICIGLLDTDNKLVAFTRILSDFTYKAIIFDVIVSVNLRGKGLGKQLMELVKNHDKLQQVKHFELYCLPEMEAFYNTYGFTAELDGIKLMRCDNS